MALTKADREFIQLTVQKVVGDALRPIASESQTLKDTVFGPNMDNGLNKAVKECRTWRAEQDREKSKIKGMIAGATAAATVIVQGILWGIGQFFNNK